MGNANSGRRPTPTAIHLLHGTARRRQQRDQEPTLPAVSVAFDTPPDDLQGNPLACAEWRRLAPLLRVSGIITAAEQPLLVTLCLTWATWIEAQTQLRAVGMLIKGKDGLPVRNPYIRIANDALQQCQRLWIELGLTPSARSRVRAAHPASLPVSKWDGLLR